MTSAQLQGTASANPFLLDSMAYVPLHAMILFEIFNVHDDGGDNVVTCISVSRCACVHHPSKSLKPYQRCQQALGKSKFIRAVYYLMHFAP